MYEKSIRLNPTLRSDKHSFRDSIKVNVFANPEGTQRRHIRNPDIRKGRSKITGHLPLFFPHLTDTDRLDRNIGPSSI